MPIFMDLHIVPGLTAKSVAEAHRQDLLIQEEYNCNCMTYWLDESKDRAFCLIEAPNKLAVRKLHNKAHGLMVHQIIKVDKTVVESFLGRINDPVTPDIPVGQLKVFNDPAFRTLLFIKILDPVLMNYKYGRENCERLLGKYRDYLETKSRRFEGEIAENKESITDILSFTSTMKAIDCALSIQDSFTEKEKELLNIKMSINAGMPVTNHIRIFGETIETGEYLLYTARLSQVAVASTINETTSLDPYNRQKQAVAFLSSSTEKLLKQLMNVLEKNSSDEKFGVAEFCKQMSLSKSSLNRATQTLTGKSPNQLLKEFRLDLALQLLKKNADSVSGIAFTTGFGSPSYFSKCFKEHFDIPPSVCFRYLQKTGQK